MGQDAGWDLAGFHDVDGALDPDALIGFLDSAKGHPVLADLQERLIAELRPAPGDRVLDAGCGPGTQALEIAQRVAGARVTGVDSSQLMIDEAQRRARDSGLDVSFQVADAGALPFPDATFAACHAQTLMEHVTDPAEVLAELRRVTRPGGRLAALDLDQGSTVLDHLDRATTRTILDAWTDDFAGGWTARSLRRLFLDADLQSVDVQVEVAEFGAPFFRALLGPTAARLAREGRLAADVLDRWWAELDERAAAGTFFVASLWFLVAGTVPAQPAH